jgi:hypothetical protein
MRTRYGIPTRSRPSLRKAAVALGWRLATGGLLLATALLLPAGAQEGPARLPYRLRKFDARRVGEYLRDEDYAYDRGMAAEAPGLWSRFWSWVGDWLRDHIFRHLFRPGTEDYWQWGFYTVCALIIGWAVLRLTGTSMRGVFFGKAQDGGLPFEENEANIHFIDFDKLIADAVGQGQYRRAVRLFYLRTLKQLSDREIIDWRPDKTNHDYLREWKRPDIEPGFRRLTTLFEYICYGDFGIDRDRFEQTQRAFQDFEAQIRNAS